MTRSTAPRRLRRPLATAIALLALGGLMAACQAPEPAGPGAAPSGTITRIEPGPSVGDADEFLVVDCLLPAKVRRLGSQLTYLGARQVTRTSGVDCEIRGGEYVAYDRADYRTALAVWQEQAGTGDPKAQNYVGEIYERGPTGTPEYPAAAEWYRKAAEQGYGPAQINLGQLYEQGLGVPKDEVVALNWYRQASGLETAGLTYVVSTDVAAELETLREEVVVQAGEAGALRREIVGLQSELGELEQARQATVATAGGGAGAASPTPPQPEGQADLAAALEGEQAALAAEAEALEARSATLEQERAAALEAAEAMEREREALVAERQALEAEWRELEAEQAEAEGDELTDALAAIQDRTALDAARSEQEGRAAALAEQEAALREREAALQAQQTEAASQGTEFARRAAEIEAQQEALAAREAGVSAQESEVAARAAEVEQRETSLAAREAALEDREQRIVAQSAESAELDQRIAALRIEVETRRQELEALGQTAEVALPGPQIAMLDPALPPTRGLPVVRTRAGLEGRGLVGRVNAPAGLLSLSLNDGPLGFNDQLVFQTTVPVPTAGTEVRLMAIDNQGRQGELTFALLPETAPSPPPDLTASAATPRLDTVPAIELGRFHALVIGNNAYPHLPTLDTAVDDAEAVADLLANRYGFEVTVLRDATRYQILSTLEAYRRVLTENDNLLIYYAGHGELDEANQNGNWLPVDAEPDSRANWISNLDITNILNTMAARRVLVVADSCYSGSLTRAALAQLDPGMTQAERLAVVEALAKKAARTALTSGGLAPTLDSGGGGHSVFARAFLDVLGENEGLMEGQQLHREVRDRVTFVAEQYDFEQVPQYAPIKRSGHAGGEFFFIPRA